MGLAALPSRRHFAGSCSSQAAPVLSAPRPPACGRDWLSVMDASFWVVTGHLYLSIREVAIFVLCPFSKGNAQVLMQGCRRAGVGRGAAGACLGGLSQEDFPEKVALL